ncbi:MAG TPA: alpha/beta fold hydrolase [Actinophytocola sp.]|uniref:alpha/beta fold hydrolase n=1 Tax=Actinophytocola sp. TaxID=1872138 RepID=UPI002DC03EEB|nr:alpha/beta fold hydrolase [Actinophytocola sp.]HEU5474186.1 alpha/beta fold hydrolase [Actinophytocola sp.]
MYAPVNGVEMYYEIHGSGRPIVLIHGALSTIGTSFGAILPALARTRRVIAVELQAHGRTADIDRPFGYPAFADDVAALLDHLGIAEADFFGYSVGAGVALEIAIRRPDLVGKLVLQSVAFSVDGMHPGLLDGIEELTPDDLAGSPFERAYAESAPDPAAWPALLDKVKEFDLDFKGWEPATVRAIAAPVLLVVGDSDIVRPEHAVELFRLLGGGVPGDVVPMPKSQFAVLPGTNHVGLPERAAWLVPMIESFLDAPA